jgi:hypothetical protein
MQQESNEKQVTIPQLLGSLKLQFRYILSKWYIVVVLGIIGGVIGFWYAQRKSYTYVGELSFVLSSGGGVNGFSGLANQLGLDLGNKDGDIFSQNNIVALFKSQKMVKRALFARPFNGQTLLNLLVKHQHLDSGWTKNARLRTAYPFPDSIDALTPVQDSIVKEIHQGLITSILKIDHPDKNESIFKVSTTSSNEFFACYFTKALVQETSEFYIETKVSVAKKNFDMLLKEEDSLRRALYGNIRTTDQGIDRTFNLNPAYQIKRAPIQQTQIEGNILAAAYTEVVRNLELAKINLQKEYPIYQILDEPTMPLKRQGKGILKSSLSAAFLFGFLAVMFLFTKNILRKQ